MTALDVRHPELDLFLHKVRGRLNRRLIADLALQVGMAAGLTALAILLFLPASWPRPTLWLGATLGAAGVGAMVKWWHRLSRAQAASWLDEALRTGGVYRAAADALDRDREIFPDALILRDADRCRRDRRPAFPWRHLTVLGLSSLGLTGAALATLIFVVPGFGPFPPGLAANQSSEGRPGEQTPPPSQGGKEPVLSPKEAGKRLFPEDQRLAALAEQALASGDAGALEALLNQNPTPSNGVPGQSSPQNSPSSGGRLGPGDPGSGFGEGSGQGAPEGSPDAQGTPGSPQRPGDTSKPGAPKASENGQGPGAGSGGQSAPGTQNSGPSAGREGYSQPGFGSGAPGNAHSDQKLGNKPPGSTGGRQVLVPEKGNPGVFESVLPESGAKLPSVGALADTRRSAEAALRRASAPQEFENAVREYFLSLSQEAKP